MTTTETTSPVPPPKTVGSMEGQQGAGEAWEQLKSTIGTAIVIGLVVVFFGPILMAVSRGC